MKNLLILTVLIACAALFTGCAAPAPEEVATPEPVVEPAAEEGAELITHDGATSTWLMLVSLLRMASWIWPGRSGWPGTRVQQSTSTSVCARSRNAS